MQYHDLSITLTEDTLPFPDSGDPHMTWEHLLDHSNAEVQVSLVSMITHLGTHADVPLHYIPGGESTAQVPLGAYCGPAVCLDMLGAGEDGQIIDITRVLEANAHLIRPGDIILLSTGWEHKVGTPAYFASPDFAADTGTVLARYQAAGLGVDLSTLDRPGVCHRGILGRGMGVIESLVNLRPLIGKRFFFSAVPLKFGDGDGSPVRAYAILDE